VQQGWGRGEFCAAKAQARHTMRGAWHHCGHEQKLPTWANTTTARVARCLGFNDAHSCIINMGEASWHRTKCGRCCVSVAPRLS
jgi:hypothetical protein